MTSALPDITEVLQAFFAERQPRPDIWRPVVEGYFDPDSERAVPAPSLFVDDWNLLFVLFVPAEPIETDHRAVDALRDVTTHLNLLFRSLRDLDMNRLLVGLVYAETAQAMARLQIAFAELPTVDRTHRLILLPPLAADESGQGIHEVVQPLMPVSVQPFLRPIESTEVLSAMRAVLSDRSRDEDAYADLLQDIEALLSPEGWGASKPWPRMMQRIGRIGAGGPGGADV